MNHFACSTGGSVSWWVRAATPVLAGLGVLLTAPTAHAEQFVFLDVTFTYTKSDADNATPSKSHYYVKSDRLNMATPTDWTQPIDYRNGRVHVRAEVLDKPAGSAETRWTLCYIARKGIDAGYGCSNTAAYKEEGVFDFEQGMTEWWQNDNIDWTQGVKQVDIVMKDNKGVFAHTMPDPEKWFPTTVRITMIQVSEGSTYDESKVPGLPSSGGGAGGGGGAASAGSAGSGGVGGSAGEAAAGGTTVGGAPASAGAAGTAASLPVAGTPGAGGAGASGAPTSGGAASTANGAPSSAASDERDETGCSLGATRAPRGTSSVIVLGVALAAAFRRRYFSKTCAAARP